MTNHPISYRARESKNPSLKLTNAGYYKMSPDKYEQLYNTFFKMLVKGYKNLDSIRYELAGKQIDPEQTTKMLEALEKNTEIAREDWLDEKLWDVLETLKLPSKWAINASNEIQEVFPFPILNSNYSIQKIIYVPAAHPNYPFNMPPQLNDRHISMYNDALANINKRLNKNKPIIAQLQAQKMALSQKTPPQLTIN